MLILALAIPIAADADYKDLRAQHIREANRERVAELQSKRIKKMERYQRHKRKVSDMRDMSNAEQRNEILRKISAERRFTIN